MGKIVFVLGLGFSLQVPVGLGLSSGGRRKYMDGKALEEMGELILYCSSVVHRALVGSGLLGAWGRGVQ